MKGGGVERVKKAAGCSSCCLAAQFCLKVAAAAAQPVGLREPRKQWGKLAAAAAEWDQVVEGPLVGRKRQLVAGFVSSR